MPASTPLSRHADATLTDQLAARFGERIRQRLLAPGARLPSVRECARRHAISPSTVVAAYDQLLAQAKRKLPASPRRSGMGRRARPLPSAPPH